MPLTLRPLDLFSCVHVYSIPLYTLKDLRKRIFTVCRQVTSEMQQNVHERFELKIIYIIVLRLLNNILNIYFNFFIFRKCVSEISKVHIVATKIPYLKNENAFYEKSKILFIRVSFNPYCHLKKMWDATPT